MKKIFFTALVGAMMISCSRDNDDTGSVTNDTSILPTKFTHSRTSGEDIVYTFSYNGNKLVKITSGFYDEIFTYTGDLITSVRSDDKYLEFGYDANGNLISEYEELYNHGAKINEKNTTYTINGSTITAEQTAKNYGSSGLWLVHTSVSTNTYTLDAQKKPIKIVEAYEETDTSGNIRRKDNNAFTYQYANHHSFLKNIKGLDKLYYSSLKIGEEKIISMVFPYSYIKGEVNVTFYHSDGSTSNENYAYETKAEYTLNTNNYPTKIIYKTPDHITGQYEESGAYDTIEYNK